MGITAVLVAICTDVIARTGLGGITLLMALESMIAPIPSEAVMPFAGFLWFEGKFTFWQILISSTLGSLIGSLISYALGAFYSEAIIHHWGKYLLLNKHHLNKTHLFFERYGEKTVFISRFVPIVRHLISIPAGVGRMNLPRFIVYTAVGATIWNMFLAWVGYELNSNWHTISQYTRTFDIVVSIIVAAGIIYLWRTNFFKKMFRIKNN